jgi:hypothetical protein
LFPFLLLFVVGLIEIAPKIIRKNDNDVVIYDEKTNCAYVIDKQTFHDLNKKL